MAELKILDVTQPEASAELWGAHVDSPVAGSESDVLAFHVGGWVLGRSSPVAHVEVWHHGQALREAAVRAPRPDVGRIHPDVPDADTCGFGALLGALGLTEEFELRLEAVLENGARVPIGAVRGRHRPLRSRFVPELQPILVTTLGRSGGTWLMRMLSEHPQVVVYPRHPYESSPARYWMHVLKVLSQPADLVAQPLAPTTHVFSLSHASQNPFFDRNVAAVPELGGWFARDYLEGLAAFCRRSTEGWYATVARHLGLDRPRYFAEKHLPDGVAALTRQLYPRAREIFLVRDLRDTICSILAFNRKRGYPAFHQKPGQSDEEFIRQFGRPGGSAQLLSSSWRERSASSHLVRYEDLVRHPSETIEGLLNYLELDASSTLVSGIVDRASKESDELRGHKTSPDAEASIGRWRERGDSFETLCDESFGDVMKELGYTTTGLAPASLSG